MRGCEEITSSCCRGWQFVYIVGLLLLLPGLQTFQNMFSYTPSGVLEGKGYGQMCYNFSEYKPLCGWTLILTCTSQLTSIQVYNGDQNQIDDYTFLITNKPYNGDYGYRQPGTCPAIEIFGPFGNTKPDVYVTWYCVCTNETNGACQKVPYATVANSSVTTSTTTDTPLPMSTINSLTTTSAPTVLNTTVSSTTSSDNSLTTTSAPAVVDSTFSPSTSTDSSLTTTSAPDIPNTTFTPAESNTTFSAPNGSITTSTVTSVPIVFNTTSFTSNNGATSSSITNSSAIFSTTDSSSNNPVASSITTSDTAIFNTTFSSSTTDVTPSTSTSGPSSQITINSEATTASSTKNMNSPPLTSSLNIFNTTSSASTAIVNSVTTTSIAAGSKSSPSSETATSAATQGVPVVDNTTSSDVASAPTTNVPTVFDATLSRSNKISNSPTTTNVPAHEDLSFTNTIPSKSATTIGDSVVFDTTTFIGQNGTTMLRMYLRRQGSSCYLGSRLTTLANIYHLIDCISNCFKDTTCRGLNFLAKENLCDLVYENSDLNPTSVGTRVGCQYWKVEYMP